MSWIVALSKFDVLKTSIFALEASPLTQIFINIKFLHGNYQPTETLQCLNRNFELLS